MSSLFIRKLTDKQLEERILFYYIQTRKGIAVYHNRMELGKCLKELHRRENELHNNVNEKAKDDTSSAGT